MAQEKRRFYNFGPFQLDPVGHVLMNGSQRISLTPKAFETLLVLIENCGHAVDKDEILKRVWPDTFVEEGTLAQNISTLRKTLGETTNGHIYIETIPRRGYRFVGQITEVSSTESDTANRPELSPPISSPPSPKAIRWVAVTGLMVVVVLLLGYFLRERLFGSHSLTVNRPTIAVLPFENLSGDQTQQYFVDGFTDEMITQLGNLDPNRLGVIARTSAMQYKDSRKGVRDIAHELNADYILEGGVMRDGSRVRIMAQLIQTQNGTNLWAKDYDRDVRDILTLQSDVAGAIAHEIELKLSPEEIVRLSTPRPVDPKVYEDYLQGRYFWNKRTEASYLKAIDYFNQAVAGDPKYAQAYSGLADAYALLGSLPNAVIPRREAMPRAKAAALTALKLDESLAEAHTSLAFVEMHYDWNWTASEREFNRAIELNPNYATAHEWYAYWFIAQGRTVESLRELDRAAKADPLSVIIKTDTAEMLVYAGRNDAAIQQAQKALELDPNFRLVFHILGEAYVGKQMYPEAIAICEKSLAMKPDDIWALEGIASAYAHLGERANAQKVLDEILNDFQHRSDSTVEIGSVYAELGESDKAFDFLNQAYQSREGGLILLNVLPPLQSIRSDPRFSDLARRVGLPARSN